LNSTVATKWSEWG